MFLKCPKCNFQVLADAKFNADYAGIKNPSKTHAFSLNQRFSEVASHDFLVFFLDFHACTVVRTRQTYFFI